MSSTSPRAFPAFLCCLFLAFAAPLAAEKLAFPEIWAYLMAGEEGSLKESWPVSDLAYCGAGLSDFGKLAGVPARTRLKNYKGRVHLVVAETENSALTHFCLDPAYPLRDALVADIVKAAEPFDGVQIDFEAVNARDYELFRDFIGLLRQGLAGKILSVALPARMSEKTDRFGYGRIAELSDRVIVMAYDEHWGSGAPGPVASIDWCRKIAAYALSKMPAEKLVMGSPFYGRAWADKSLSRALRFSGVANLFSEKGIAAIQRKVDIPFVEYEESVRVLVFFDDLTSLVSRLSMYRSASVRNVAFWRLGQEDTAIWDSLSIETATPEPAAEPEIPLAGGP